MRSSKISRDTARLITALSSRRSLRSDAVIDADSVAHTTGHTYTSSKSTSELAALDSLKDESDPDLWPPPESENFDTSLVPSTPTTSLKRKHDSPHNASQSSTITPARRSARKPVSTKSEASSPVKRAKRSPIKRTTSAPKTISTTPPANWEQIYSITAAMRSEWPAPVDTMGCESLAEDHRSPIDRRFQTLVALMLSSQTKDTVTAVAMKNLQDNLPGGFTLDSIIAVDPVTLNELIAKVGFHNNKTKFIKQTAALLKEKWNGDIPETIEGMISLPGVGPKMAYLCMSAAWGRDEGIGVDVHVHRITNLWRWHGPTGTKTPEETRANLEAWLPKEKWHDINHLLVGFGYVPLYRQDEHGANHRSNRQTYCPPVGRKCGDCRLGQERLCPSAVMEKTTKRVKKEIVKKEEDGTEDFVVKTEIEVQIKEEPRNEEPGDVFPPSQLLDIEDIGR